MNTKIEEFLDGIKLGELLHRQEAEQKKDNKCMIAIVVCGIVAIVAILAYTVYKLISPRLDNYKNTYDDFDDDFDFSFDNDYASDDED